MARGAGVDVADLFARLSAALLRDCSTTENMVRRGSPEKLLNKVEALLAQAIVECDALGLASAMGPAPELRRVVSLRRAAFSGPLLVRRAAPSSGVLRGRGSVCFWLLQGAGVRPVFALPLY